MKFKVDFDIELNDETLLGLVDEMETLLTEEIFRIEEEQIENVMDLIGGVVPTAGDDEEMMEKAFDLVQEVQCHIFYQAMKRWNLVRKPIK